jgi:hypothetical protein
MEFSRQIFFKRFAGNFCFDIKFLEMAEQSKEDATQERKTIFFNYLYIDEYRVFSMLL